MARGTEDVITITDAPRPASEDRDERMRRYTILMGIRVVCFVAAIALLRGPIRIAGVIGAVVLPLIAVIFANARNRHRTSGTPAFHQGPDLPRREIS